MNCKIKKQVLLLSMKEEYENMDFLLKYSPKYYQKVECGSDDLKIGKTRRRMKCVKLIRSVDIKDFEENERDLVINIFQSQKSVLECLNINDGIPNFRRFHKLERIRLNVENLSCWRNFVHSLNLKGLSLEFPNAFKFKGLGLTGQDYKKYLSWRFWNHLRRLKKLKKLNVQIYNKFDAEISEFLSRLNSQESLLMSLDRIKLFLNHSTISEFESEKYERIFSLATDLQIHELTFQDQGKILNSLNYFKNLISLEIMKTIGISNSDHTNNAVVESIKELRNLKDLGKLERLDLAIHFSYPDHLIYFLESISLPKYLVSVKLTFHETSWKNLEINMKETENRFSEFYKRWNDLKSLKMLSLCFTEAEDHLFPSVYFVVPLLKNLCSLETLYYTNLHNDLPGKKKPVDFQILWESMSHLKPTLKNLYLETFAISIRNLKMEKFKEEIKLEELGLCGFVIGSSQMTELGFFFEKRRNNKRLHLEIERLMIESDEDFFVFLDNLKSIPKDLRVGLAIDIRKVTEKGFIDGFYKILPILKKRKLLELSIWNLSHPESDRFEALCTVLCETDVFRNLIILDCQENELFNCQEALVSNKIQESFDGLSQGSDLLSSLEFNESLFSDNLNDILDVHIE